MQLEVGGDRELRMVKGVLCLTTEAEAEGIINNKYMHILKDIVFIAIVLNPIEMEAVWI